MGDGNVAVSWKTNIPATSQVLYGSESIEHPTLPQLYGYATSSPEYVKLKTSHTVIINGLDDGVQYWFRPLSDNSDTVEVYGIELTYDVKIKKVVVAKKEEPSVCNYLLEYIKLGNSNNPVEVRKLENFLNEFEGEKLVVNGIYERVDFEAVERFQEKYSGDVLSPWNHIAPTGYVYITTKKKINEVYCEREFPLTNDEQEEIGVYSGFLTTSNVDTELIEDEVSNTVFDGVGGPVLLPEVVTASELIVDEYFEAPVEIKTNTNEVNETNIDEDINIENNIETNTEDNVIALSPNTKNVEKISFFTRVKAWFSSLFDEDKALAK